VVVRVGGQKRTIMLPPALSAYSASGARFEDGRLEISFEKRPEALGSAECAGEGFPHGD